MKDIEAIISEILVREGGFVNHPDDRGGPTNFGVTQAALASWRGKPVTVEDVRNLREDEARAIYRDRYVVAPGFAGLPDPLRGLMVDCGVNHGPMRAVLWLQKAVGASPDGDLGPQSQDAISKADLRAVYRKVLASRIRHYGRIITDNPKQSAFAAGWANRAAGFVEGAP